MVLCYDDRTQTVKLNERGHVLRTGRLHALSPGILAALRRYEIDEFCWTTRHANVFSGRLNGEKLRVLIKLPSASQNPQETAEWLQRDYDIAQAVRSPVSAKLFALEQTEVGPALVYVDEDARPLEAIVTGRPLAIDSVLTIGLALVDAVADLQKENLVHANLNIASVWYCAATGEIRISEFGCARHASSGSGSPRWDRLADVRFIAPEQTGRIHQVVDQRTDIYAIGIILYHLLTGQFPFDGTDALDIMDGHLAATPSFPSGPSTALPAPIADVVLKCLSKNVDGRYLSATGLRADLLRCQSQWRANGSIEPFPLGEKDATGLLRIPRKLYGRELETGILRDFVRKARRGPPAILLVNGDPGVGKSAFLNQLGDFVRSETGRFVSGKFDQYKRNVPYFSVIEAFRQLVHQLLTEVPAELAGWKSKIVSATENATQVVINVIPEIELITGPQQPVPSLAPTEARNRFNRTFSHLIQTFARAEQPLCIFMDDLQWADAPSLELLIHVLNDPNTKHLLFVGAYRRSEVGQAHPLSATMNTLASTGFDLQSIELHPLRKDDVLPLIQETFSLTSKDGLPLAQLLHSRSQGNPLYLTQLINFLYDTRLIGFDYSCACWRWDIRRIQAEAVTDDILDLLGLRIKALQPETREFLSTAACVGSTFEAAKVAVAAAQADIMQSLSICVRADLLSPVCGIAGDDAHKHDEDWQVERRRFRFLHDRIQQVAFDLVSDRDKKAFRLRIGRRLLARLAPEELNTPQVDVLNNLNYAWDLVTEPDEKRTIARLNLVAGRKAREALAYQDALRYLSVGFGLLDESAWENDYELAFELHANALECEYLNGAFNRADELFARLIAKSRSRLDRAKIYLTKILLDTSEERYDDAIKIGVHALRTFGIRYSRNPGVASQLRELVLARIRMRGRRPYDLLRMRPLEDAEILAPIRILVALFPTAYFLSPDLLMFTGLKVVNYSLRHGLSSLSASGFVLYGLGLGAAFNKYESGYEFGRLAVELAERDQDSTVLCKVLVIFSQFIKFWRDPLDTSLPLIDRARKLALQVGDHQYVNYAIIGGISLRFSRGTKLTEVIEHCGRHAPFVRQSKDAFPIEAFLMWQAAALALVGNTRVPYSLDNGPYREEVAEEHYRKTGNRTLLSYQYTLRLQLRYLFGRYEDALALSELGQAVIASAPGYITVADHYLYRGLAAAAILALRKSGGRELRRKALHSLRRLKVFAANCPQNFLPHATLLKAELAASSGDNAAALKLYNKVIELAGEQRFTHLVALANERAALCASRDGQQRLGEWYRDCSRTAYDEWGALAKTAAMDRECATSSSKEKAHSTRGTGLAGLHRVHAGAFDIAAAAAVSQAAASEENKDRVLREVLHAIRVQTGAEVANLIVLSGGATRLEMSLTADDPDTPQTGEANAARAAFSPSVVNYAIHTATDLVLNLPHLDPRFTRCEYLADRQPSSVMCTPIIKQSQVLGVIYLEHRRLTNVFDRQKLEWLRILATHVGATVWTDTLSRYREYLHRFAPTAAVREIDADPHSPDLTAREQDVSVLFADLAGYTRMHELMELHQTDKFVNRAFSEFVDDIHRFHGVLLSVHGDELFAFFQDEDPVRHVRNACHAALSISRTATRFNQDRSTEEPSIVVNMGINTGSAAIGLQLIEIPSGSRWRYDATGSTVNVAARIRELAKGGDILISAAVAERIKGQFDLEDLGEHALKNVSRPVCVYRLTRAISTKHE